MLNFSNKACRRNIDIWYELHIYGYIRKNYLTSVKLVKICQMNGQLPYHEQLVHYKQTEQSRVKHLRKCGAISSNLGLSDINTGLFPRADDKIIIIYVAGQWYITNLVLFFVV